MLPVSPVGYFWFIHTFPFLLCCVLKSTAREATMKPHSPGSFYPFSLSWWQLISPWRLESEKGWTPLHLDLSDVIPASRTTEEVLNDKVMLAFQSKLGESTPQTPSVPHWPSPLQRLFFQQSNACRTQDTFPLFSQHFLPHTLHQVLFWHHIVETRKADAGFWQKQDPNSCW